mgnify:CR=1 FL=1
MKIQLMFLYLFPLWLRIELFVLLFIIKSVHRTAECIACAGEVLASAGVVDECLCMCGVCAVTYSCA